MMSFPRCWRWVRLPIHWRHDAKKINDFKDAVVDGLDGIKQLLDTVKEVFKFVNWMASGQKFFWDLGEQTGVHKLFDPKRGAGGPGTIDFGTGAAEDAPSKDAPRGQFTPNPDPNIKPELTPIPELVLPRRPFVPTPTPQQPFIPTPPDAKVGTDLEKAINSQPQHPESRGWSLFNPRTWFGGDAKASPAEGSWTDKANQIPTNLPPLDANKPTRNATPEEAEVRGGGFRIPGTDQSIGFGDQTVTLKTGGTVVQSGNPLPVRIEKIDPTAGGIDGVGGGSGGDGSWIGGGLEDRCAGEERRSSPVLRQGAPGRTSDVPCGLADG